MSGVSIETDNGRYVLHSDYAALEAELQLWADALADWRAQRFLACRNKLKTLRAQDANLFLYRLCDERVASLIHTPPSSVWDGTTVIGEK